MLESTLEIVHESLISFTRNDPTRDRGSQVPHAAAPIISSVGFVHDWREDNLTATPSADVLSTWTSYEIVRNGADSKKGADLRLIIVMD